MAEITHLLCAHLRTSPVLTREIADVVMDCVPAEADTVIPRLEALCSAEFVLPTSAFIGVDWDTVVREAVYLADPGHAPAGFAEEGA